MNCPWCNGLRFVIDKITKHESDCPLCKGKGKLDMVANVSARCSLYTLHGCDPGKVFPEGKLVRIVVLDVPDEEFDLVGERLQRSHDASGWESEVIDGLVSAEAIPNEISPIPGVNATPTPAPIAGAWYRHKRTGALHQCAGQPLDGSPVYRAAENPGLWLIAPMWWDFYTPLEDSDT